MQNNLSRIPVNKLYCKDVGIPTVFLPGYGINGNRQRIENKRRLKT